jgi:hypothetical protein
VTGIIPTPEKESLEMINIVGVILPEPFLGRKNSLKIQGLDLQGFWIIKLNVEVISKVPHYKCDHIGMD